MWILGFTKKELELIKKQALEFWDEATDKQAKFFNKVNDYNRLYHVKLPKEFEDEITKHKDRSQMVPPDIYNNVLGFRAAIKELVFGRKPYGIVSILGQPTLRSEVVKKAEAKLSELIDISRFKKEADKAIHQAAVCGLSCVFTEWHRFYRPIPIRDEDKNIIELPNTLIATFPRTRAIDIRRIRIDDKAETVEDARLIGYHAKVNMSDLIIANNDPNNPINFIRSELQDSSFPAEKYYEYVSEEHTLYGHEVETKYGDKPVELIDIRGIFQIRNQLIDLIVKIANRKIVIDARPNNLPIPGWELFSFPSVDSEHNRIYPMGIIEPALDVFLEEFIKRNQSIDKSNRDVYDQYLADAAGAQDLPDRIPYKPGHILKLHLGATGSTRLADIFSPIPKGGASPFDTFQQSMACQQEVQQTMRQSDWKQGTDPKRRETATAVTELVVGGRRLDLQVVDHLKDSFFAPQWKNYLILWNFFNGKEKGQVADDEGNIVDLLPGDLDYPFNVDIDVASAVERPIVQRRVVESYPFLVNDPMWDPYQLRKTFAWALQLPNPDKLLPNPGWREAVIDRENSALLNGVLLPVHPLDDHAKHIQGHRTAIEQLVDDPEIDVPGKTIAAFEKHLQQHETFFAQQQPQNPGNPKLGEKGETNQGQMAGGASPKIPNVNVVQPTSQPG